MFSRTTVYALRAVVFLAGSDGRLRAAEEIARETASPPGYMAKVLKDLAEAGIVASRRGPKGGYQLTRPATEMTVFDVFSAVDPIRTIAEWPIHLEERHQRMCPLHRRLNEAISLVENTLRAVSIAELLTEPPSPSQRPSQESDQRDCPDGTGVE